MILLFVNLIYIKKTTIRRIKLEQDIYEKLETLLHSAVLNFYPKSTYILCIKDLHMQILNVQKKLKFKMY